MHLTKLKVYFVDLSLNQKFNLDERLGLILNLIWIKQRSNNKCSQPKITYSLKCFITKLFFASKGSIFFLLFWWKSFFKRVFQEKAISFFFSRGKKLSREQGTKIIYPWCRLDWQTAFFVEAHSQTDRNRGKLTERQK